MSEKTPRSENPADDPKSRTGDAPPEDSAGAAPEDVEPIVGGSRREKIQSAVIFALILVGALIALFWPRETGPPEAPWGEIETAEGEKLEMETVAEPETLVHFWATWCIPCLDEVPRILRFEESRDDVSVLMVAVGDHVPDVEKFLDEHAPGATTYYDHKWRLAKDWETDKLPETHLVVDGRLLDTFVGATEWDDPAVRRRVANEIAKYRAGIEDQGREPEPPRTGS